MKLAFCVTDSHIEYVVTIIESVRTFHPNVAVAILSSDLSEGSMSKLNQLRLEELRLYTELDIKRVSQLPLTLHHITIETYFRYFLPSIILDWDRVLYLDSDVLVSGNLSECWETDLSDVYMAGVSEIDITQHYADYKQQIGFEVDALYVNAGVLLMNLAAMRRDHITELLLSETIRLKDQIQFQDQDVINIALKGRIAELSIKYNYTAEAMRQQRLLLDEVAIFHFNSAHIKPWVKWDKEWIGQIGDSIALWRKNYIEIMKRYGGVSVILAVHNQQATLRHTLHTLVNQLFHNIEIIIIDAGSDDDSSIICQEFCSRDSRILYEYQSSPSLNAAKERGLYLSSRPYVLFIEEGDFVFDEGIRVLHQFAEATQSDILIGAFARFQGGCFQFLSYAPYRLARKSLSAIAQEMQCSEMKGTYYTKVWGNLYKRTLLTGLHFLEEAQLHESFVWSAYRRAQNIQVLSQQVYVRRIDG